MPFPCQTYAFGPRCRSIDNHVYVIVEQRDLPLDERVKLSTKASVAVTYNLPWKRVLEEWFVLNQVRKEDLR